MALNLMTVIIMVKDDQESSHAQRQCPRHESLQGEMLLRNTLLELTMGELQCASPR